MSGERKSMPVSSGRARCKVHGLALGPDDQCVLCRREAQPQVQGNPRATGSSFGSAIGNLLFGLLGVSIALLALFFAMNQGEAPRSAPPVVAPVPGTEQAVHSPSSAGSQVAPRHFPTGSSRRGESERPAHSSTPAFNDDRADPSRRVDDRGDAPRPSEIHHPPPSLSQDELVRYLGQVQVELYTTSWCGYCKQARAFLQGNGVSFREYDVETDSSAAARKRSLVSGSGVPVARIDGQVLSGFSATRYGEAIRSSIERRSGVSVELTLK